MNNLNVLGDSVRDTLGRLRDKQAFLHQHKKYYLSVRSQLLELNTRKDEDDEDDIEEKMLETGLEFNDIIISTKRRIFVSIGYEYFVERNREEAVEFADDKLKLISEAIVQFGGKIQEAELTEKRIKELAEKGDDFDDEFQGDEEEGLPAMEIREELDDAGNVTSSSVTPSANQKTRKELEGTLLGEQRESNERQGLNEFEKNLKGRLVREEEKRQEKEKEKEKQREKQEREKREREKQEREKQEREKQEREKQEREKQEREKQEREKREQEERHHQADPPPLVDMENVYTFDDLVREMDERDDLEDQLDEGEYLQSEDEEEDDDDDDDDTFGYSIVPGSMAQGSFMEQIEKLRKGRLPPPKSILKSNVENSRPKKTVGFAENADVHEVENLKEVNRGNRHNPLIQIPDDGSNLSNEEFDGDLFAKLIGVQGPDEIHEKYRQEVETKERQEQEKAHSKKRVSRFKLERVGKEESSVGKQHGEDSPDAVSDIVEKDLDEQDPSAENPVSDVVEKDLAEQDPNAENPVSDIVEKDLDEQDPSAENPVSDIVEKDLDEQDPSAENPVSDVVEKDLDEQDPNAENPVSDVVEKDLDDQDPSAENPVSDVVEKDLDEQDPNAENPVSDVVEKDLDDQDPSAENPVSDVVEKGLDDQDPSAKEGFNIELDPPHPGKGFISRKPLRSLRMPKRKAKPQQIPKIEQLGSDEEDDKNISEPEPELLSNKHNGNSSANFPPEIRKAARGPQKQVVRPNVDYKLLGENLDDMARAYALGIYDDDLHDDPGTLVEKLDDFKSYNKQVEQLEDDIREFRLNNPQQEERNRSGYDDGEDDDNVPMMTDVKEKDLPPNYDDIFDEDEDLSLHPDKLNESIAINYYRLKESLVQDKFAEGRTEEEKQIEPIDEWGNPLRPSRFKSRRFGIGD